MTQPMMTLAQAAWRCGGKPPRRKCRLIASTLTAGRLSRAICSLRSKGSALMPRLCKAGARRRRSSGTGQPRVSGRARPAADSRCRHARRAGQLAAFWRQQFSLPVAGITGSNGKTSVKEMVAAILNAAVGEDQVLATRGNLNNDIGMPLTFVASACPASLRGAGNGHEPSG